MKHSLRSKRSEVALVFFAQKASEVSCQLTPTLRAVSVDLKARWSFVSVIEGLGAGRSPIERVERIRGVVRQNGKKLAEVGVAGGGVLVVQVMRLQLRVKELGAEEHGQQMIHLVNDHRALGVLDGVVDIGVNLQRSRVINFERKASSLEWWYSHILCLNGKEAKNVATLVN